jgi:hypothetical protein
MREEVRKGGDDEAKVELSKNTKLADFRSSFRVLAARLSERWGPSLTVTNQRAEWRLKDIPVVA